MNFLEFIINLLWLISIDVFVIFTLYFIIYRYIDLKYFSKLEIVTLKEENNYLKKENRKINGTSTNFWNKSDKL